MTNFLHHVLRLLDPFYELPTKTVPSAACTDEQVNAWSEAMYEEALAREPAPHTGEPTGDEASETPTITIADGTEDRAFTPDELDRLRYGRSLWGPLRRTLGLMAFGAMFAAGILTAGKASADPVSEYIIRNADRVCSTLEVFPSFDGVTGVMQAVMEEGHFTIEQAAKVVVLSVNADCPWHMQLLRDFAATSKVQRA